MPGLCVGGGGKVHTYTHAPPTPHQTPTTTGPLTCVAGQVKLGSLDATAYQSTAGRFDVKGYPTIKVFPNK